MPTLEEMLAEEREKFVLMESFLRQFAKQIRNLPSTPSESEIDRHLATCRDYYEIYGTRDGEHSPWWTSRRDI